jgi:uncharacterized protein YigE (DUF2233 family)
VEIEVSRQDGLNAVNGGIKQRYYSPLGVWILREIERFREPLIAIGFP